MPNLGGSQRIMYIGMLGEWVRVVLSLLVDINIFF